MYSYFAYGLGIQSNLPLPEFVSKQLDGDVFIHMKNITSNSKLNKVNESYLEISEEESVLVLENVGTIQIRAGCEIIISPSPEADIRRVRRFIVGTAMAILLYQRGYLVLHASAVNVDNRAIAFIGLSGSGKSSLAAAMHTRGYGVLTDDVSGIDMTDDEPMVVPGFPQLKLSLSSAEAVGLDVDENKLIDDVDEKYGYHLDHGFTDIPLPLKQVYILEENPRVGIELLSQQTAVIKFISLSIPTLWAQVDDANHFLQCVKLAKLIPTYTLKRDSRIQSLPDLAEFVDGHLRG
jgi:hypothetical protein